MKAITENVLRKYIEEVGTGAVVYAESLVNLLQEIDTLTVLNLRPMSEAPKNKYIQVSLGKGGELSPGYIKNDYLNCSGANYAINAAKGWLPMQIYKPELTGDGE